MVVVDDGPMTTCDMGTDADVVIERIAVSVLWDVARFRLVLIVTDGIPVTVEHKPSNARNENT
jgi:hypothetical protein